MPATQVTYIKEPSLDYLSSRGVSKATAERYGVKEADGYIRDLGRITRCVAFPYRDIDGTVTGHKLRSIEGKGFAFQGTSPQNFFGISELKEGDIYITEGEIDALSLIEAGFNAISLPNGASKITKNTEELPYLWNAKDILDRATKIVLAFDKDDPGEAMAEEISRRLGRYRCWKVSWPEGCKDANETLVKLGQDTVIYSLEKASPWPVQGLYDALNYYDEVKEIKKNGLTKGFSTGYSKVDEIYTVMPGQMTIVTGYPGAGKSEFVDQLMVNLAEKEDWRFAICSFENEPRLHLTKLLSKRMRSEFNSIPDESFDFGYDWLVNHFVFLSHSDGALADLDSILDRLKIAVMRYGIRGAVIDPYNYVSRNKNMSETEWISDMLTRVKAFCMAYGVHLWFIVHPTKIPRQADGSRILPAGDTATGSAAWWAKADMGMTIHRPDVLTTQVHIWKVRFAWLGKTGDAYLSYDSKTTRFMDGESIFDEF